MNDEKQTKIYRDLFLLLLILMALFRLFMMNKFELYDNDMEKAYCEMHRVLKKDKYCAVVIGNVTFQGQEVNTTKNVVNYCEKIGFKTIKKIEKIIYGLYNVMQKEYILIFQK